MQRPSVFIRDDSFVQELNDRAYSRVIPSVPIQQTLDVRSTSTRRMLYPTLECRKPAVSEEERIVAEKSIVGMPYNNQTHYLPGSKAPFSGFATYVDHESVMRNQFMSAQKYSVQREYVPSSTSDMYVDAKFSQNKKQTHEHLFEEVPFHQTKHNTDKMSRKPFFNPTRQDIKNL